MYDALCYQFSLEYINISCPNCMLEAIEVVMTFNIEKRVKTFPVCVQGDFIIAGVSLYSVVDGFRISNFVFS